VLQIPIFISSFCDGSYSHFIPVKEAYFIITCSSTVQLAVHLLPSCGIMHHLFYFEVIGSIFLILLRIGFPPPPTIVLPD
jgi:hypothetical protein